MAVKIQTCAFVDDCDLEGSFEKTHTHYGLRVVSGIFQDFVSHYSKPEFLREMINEVGGAVNFVEIHFPNVFSQVKRDGGLYLNRKWIPYRPMGEEEEEE